MQFDTSINLEYLGVDANEVRRQVWRLEESGQLKKTEFPGVSGPTQKMIEEYESKWMELAKASKDPKIPTLRQQRESDGGDIAGSRDNWETIGNPLGAGGQSTVYLVRRPARLKARTQDLEQILSFSPWGTSMADTRAELTEKFADAVADLGRADSPAELGALKEFKLRNDEQQAISRLRQEVEMLGQGRPGLPKLLDSNLNERWMVTEYFPHGTLEANYSKYAGDVRRALKAFLSLAKIVEALHAQGIVHRDMKPANVFVREDTELILGDFGIVYLPDQPARLTRTNETVGPHDYMPPWAEIGGRLDRGNFKGRHLHAREAFVVHGVRSASIATRMV